MAESPERIRRHLAVLEEFEQAYGEYLVERRNLDHDWSGEEWARRERALKEVAPQAEAAMVAAGARRWDEGPVRIDLPARILRFVDEGDGIDDTAQWRILDEIPTHIGSLKGSLQIARALPNVETDVAPPTTARAGEAPTRGPWWREHLATLVIGIVGSVVSGLILWLILGG